MSSKSGSTGSSTATFTSGSGGDQEIRGTTSTIDTVNYSSLKASQATVSQTAGTWHVAYTGGSSSGSKSGGTTGSGSKTSGGSTGSGTGTGTDTLFSIERLQFSDKAIALDVASPNDTAGAALALYYAGFNAQPDEAVFGRWIYEADKALSSSSKSGSQTPVIQSLAQTMLDNYVPGGVSNAELVKVLYQNVVGTAPTPDEINHFTGLLANGTYTQASLFALAAEQPQNLNDYASLVGQGLAYTPYSSSKAG